MVSTFKANSPQNNFLLLAYGLILKLPTFLHPVISLPKEGDGILYKGLFSLLSFGGHGIPFLYNLVAFLLLYFQAIVLNKLVNNQRLLPKPSYLTGMSFLLITSLFPSWIGFSAPLLVITLLIWLLSRICTLYTNQEVKKALFNIGLSMGLCTLLYFPSIIFSLLLLSGLAITRTFKLPEWIIMIIGMGAPYYFLWSYGYITGNSQVLHNPAFALSKPIVSQSTLENIALMLVLFSFCIGLYFIQSNMRRLLAQSRKTWSILYLFLLISLVFPFLNTKPDFLYWQLAAVPFSAVLAATFFYSDQKWFVSLLHWSMVVVVGVEGYFYLTH